MGVIVVAGFQARSPYAPTLVSLPNGSYADLSGTPTFTWQYNPAAVGTSQVAYAFEQITNGGTTAYWNASVATWQSTVVWNAQTGESVVFPSGAWANGNVYQWSVATQDQNGQGPFAAPFTLNAQGAPSVTVTSPAGTLTTAAPVVAWTAVFGSGASQTAYRVVIYTSAQYGSPSFAPGVSTGVYDSGVVGSQATALALQSIPFFLADYTAYRVYVQLTETGGQTSQWAYSSSYTSYTAPTAPTVTAADGTDATTGQPVIFVTVVAHDNYLSLTDANPTLGIGSWRARSNCTVTSVP